MKKAKALFLSGMMVLLCAAILLAGCQSGTDPNTAPTRMEEPDPCPVTLPFPEGWGVAVNQPGLPIRLEGGRTVTYTLQEENRWIYDFDAVDVLTDAQPCGEETVLPAGKTVYWTPYWDVGWDETFDNGGKPCFVRLTQYTDGHVTGLSLVCITAQGYGDPGDAQVWYGRVAKSVAFPMQNGAYQPVGEKWIGDWFQQAEADASTE